MAFKIKNPPEFTLEVEQWTRETDADGEEMSIPIGDLLNNDIFLKTELERQKTGLERQGHVTLITLTASGWSGTTAPYAQTVPVSGAEASLEPVLVSALADGASLETQKAYIKAYGLICQGTAMMEDGAATFKVYKKPATDITIGLKGV